MFSCVVHNWNSHSAPCPMCFPATYTSDSGTDDDIVIINRAVYPCPSCAALQSSLKEKEKECEELKELIYSIRPKAEAYDRVCNNVGVENNLISKFEELKAENERLKDQLDNIVP